MTILISRGAHRTGGPAAFIDRLTQELSARGHTFTDNFFAPFDVLLATADCSPCLALLARLRGKRVVQRLDGVYHPALGGWTRYFYALRNLRLRLIRNVLADHVIYQSRFAQRICARMLGPSLTPRSIIYNAVDLTTHPPIVGPQRQRARRSIQLAIAAHFRRRDQLEPILHALTYLTIPYALHIFGSYSSSMRPLMIRALQFPPVRYHGALRHAALARELTNYDIFLFSDLSACPNVVLEALAAGLPIVAYARGSLPELIEPGITGELVTLPPHDPLRTGYPFTQKSFRSFAQSIASVAAALPAFSAAARARAEHWYDIRRTASQYEQVLRPDQ